MNIIYRTQFARWCEGIFVGKQSKKGSNLTERATDATTRQESDMYVVSRKSQLEKRMRGITLNGGLEGRVANCKT